MAIINLKNLSKSDFEECSTEAIRRVQRQVQDAKNGNIRAMNSYGTRNKVDARSIAERENDAMMGAIGEFIICKLTGQVWTKEIGQYDGNENPDLRLYHNGNLVDCDIRATGFEDSVIHRPHQDLKKTKWILFAITNVPKTMLRIRITKDHFCRCVWTYFEKFLGKCKDEWFIDTGSPYYKIPLSEFSKDFSSFCGK